MTQTVDTDFNFQFSVFNFQFLLGVRQAAGLSAISLLASIFPAPQFPLPNPKSPFPNSNSHHLAKDAASIPNAPLKTENSN